jgi:hypothetical protein
MFSQILNSAVFQAKLFIPKAFADIDPIKLDSDLKFKTTNELISSILQILMILVLVLAVVYLIIGGYQYVTAGGNPEAAAKAKNTILGSVIGIIVAFSAYLIVKFIFESLSK